MLCIKVSIPSLTTQVEEIRDSEDDNSDASSPSKDNNKLSLLAAIIRSSLLA
jgi:hypothetical protein